MKPRARCVRPNQIHLAWPAIKEYISTSWPGQEDKVLFQALRGHYQLWLVLDGEDLNGIFITAVHEENDERILRLIYLAGSFARADFAEIKDAMLAMQKHTHCVRIEGTPDFKAPRFLRSLGGQTDDGQTYWRN